MSGPPEGFVEIRAGDARAWALSRAEAWARRALESSGSLHAAAARDRGAIRLQGRGPLHAVPVPTEAGGTDDADGRWVVRRYRRGGVVARVLGDRYLALGPRRPFEELRASREVRRRGIPTPRVIAAAVYPAGPFYRGDLVTSFVPDALELAHVLFDPRRRGLSGANDRREALAEAGSLIRRCARAGVHHVDLNARNILLEWSGGAPHGHLLDLDRCRISERATPDAASAMEKRLRRSIAKIGKKSGLPVPEGDLRSLSKGLGA